jgi:hypothetical protein
VLSIIPRALEVRGRALCVPASLECLALVCVNRPAPGWAKTTKDSCLLCEKLFYGKQNFTRCCERDLSFHCSCLQASVSKCNAYTTDTSTYKCNCCIKIIRAATNDHTLIKNKQKEVVSPDVECISSSIRNYNSIFVQPEAVCLNGMTTFKQHIHS